MDFLVKNMQKIAKNFNFSPIFSQPDPLKKNFENNFFSSWYSIYSHYLYQVLKHFD